MANILIIDDPPYLEQLLAEELFGQKHRIIIAANGEEAMEQFRSCQPDIVLLDPYLQGPEGWNLLHRLKQKNSRVPVLIVTAYYGFISDACLAEADGYIIKDIYPEPLIKKINDVLARHSLNHRL